MHNSVICYSTFSFVNVLTIFRGFGVADLTVAVSACRRSDFRPL